jgi:membrane associated rhomboid family serine protease
MTPAPEPAYSFLYGTRRAEMVPAIERALLSAGIPYHSGLLAGADPQLVFTVPEDRLDEARRLVERAVGEVPSGAAARSEEDLEEDAWEAARDAEEMERRRAAVPHGPLQAAGALVLAHFAVLFTLVGPQPTAARLAAVGGLVRGQGPIEAWRLVTSLFLHTGVRHVAWNGLSLMAFAVPAVLSWGYARAGVLYLAAGIGGGLAALLAQPEGTVTVGSSGAVAGLFGAWLVATLRRAGRAPMTRRARVRAVGVGLLILPSLLSPMTSEGRPVSVAAHLGGLVTGAAVGWVLEILIRRSDVDGRGPAGGDPP